MSIAYSIAREYLERSPFPIVALDLILNLPDTEGAEEEFFEKFCKFIGDRQLSQIINATSIQYYSLFNKLHDMIRKILVDLDSSATEDPSQLPNHQRKLLKCLTCIYDLVFICEDTSSLKIQTIFHEILEYISSVPHITSLYAIASILFFCKTASQTDFETYPKILFHGTPFMKFFDAYSMDLGSIFQLSDLSPKSVNSITNSYLNIAKHGKIILDFFQQEASNLNPDMPIKFLATQIIEKYSLIIEPSSYAYYELLGEILLGSYIHESRIEDLVSVLTSIQSFCGIFLDFVYQKDEGAKYSVFPTSKLYQEFEPLPHPSIIDVIVGYFQKIMACETQEQQIPYMRKLHTIVKSLSLSLQMESYFANRKRYKPQFTRLLHKFLIPEGNNKEFGLWELICLGEELCQGITRSFSSVKEIKHFLMIEKYIPFEFYAEEILEYILEIVESSMLEITMQDEETSMEVSLIMPEYYYAGRKLNDHFQKKCLSFNWTDNYMNVYLWRDYFLCLRAFFSIKENVNDGLVTKIFTKFEELVRLSAEEDLLEVVRNSSDPEALIKKHRYLLNLLKGEFRIIIAKEDIEGSPFQTLFNQIATSSLLEFLIDLSDKHKKDKASEEILQNCAHTFTFLHTLAQITYPDIDKITFYVEATVQAVSKLIMDFIKEPYKFYEVSCFFFQVLKDIDLLFKTFTLIPKHFEKLFTEILPDVNIHYQQLAHFFDPLLQHVFQVVHVINYQDANEQEECVRYIKTFLRISKKVIETIKQDFLSHDFGPQNGGGSLSPVYKDSKITLTPHEQLVNQSFLCKIKSKVLLFGKIFRDILQNIEGLVFLAIPTNITEICELINDIFNNPILLYMEWSCMSRFLDSMKKICAHNEAFQKYTLERAFQNFLEITSSLENLVLDEDLPRDSERLQTLKGLINYHRDFWDYYKEHEVDVINYLGHKLLFSIVKLDTLALFFDYFFDTKGKVTMESLTPVLNKYETILQVCVKLETIFKFDILSGVAEAEPNKAGDLSSLESMNLYMKVLILYIFPSMLQGPSFLPFDTLKKLADFICENLDFVGLTKQEIKKDPTKLIRQMHIFSLMLAHFPIEHTHKYMNFRMFISIETVLGTVLQWIASLLKKFDKISNSKWQIISRLENLLSKFMKQLHIIMQDLYKIPSAVITDSWSSLEKVKEKEREYYTYLCDMIKTDFPYYENFSSKDTLYKIFNSLHYFIETMNKYQFFHKFYKKTKAKKSKGKSRKETQEDQANDLSGTMSNLSNEEFFEEMHEKLHESFKLGLKTPCFLIFVLSNESVQNDIYTLFGPKYLETIENMLEGLLIKGAKEIKQENILIENKIVENTKINANNEVFLNFLFYKKKAQKSLRVIEYINVVLAVAVKHCQRFKESAGVFLDYSHEYGIEVLNNFSITSFMNLKGENTLQTLINCYNSLLSRVTLLSLYKVRLNMLKLNKNFQLRDQKIIDDSFEMVLKQFQLQSEFKKKILPQGLFIRETYEPYLFLFSLWWYNEDYIRRLMTKPEMVMLLLDNANSDLSLRFLVSIFTICGVNAFPASQICEIIVKGLTFSDQTGRLLLNSGRVDVYQEIVGKFMKQAIDYCFKIDPLKISLAHPDDSFGSVTLSEFPKTAGTGKRANNKKGENNKPVERVPTYDYLLGGMNQVTKKTLESLLEVYLQWFDEEVCAIYESRDWNKRIFHPIFIMSLLIYKFPELVPYLLSYPVKLDRYNFPKYFDVNKVNPEMNFFEFMVRINFYYFPSFIFIHEFVCYNSRQPLAIQFAGETVLMHELFARFFLEEILKVLQEDLESQPENFCSTPQSIRKWGIYPTIAFHIFAMCSYKERTYIPIVMFEKYIKFILLCVATWRKNRPNGYYELVNPLFRLLRELAHFSLLQGMRVRLQKMDNDIPQKEWIWIQDYKKCMKLVKFLGKKSRDTVQKQAKEKKNQAMNIEDGKQQETMEIEKDKADYKKYDKEIPYLGNNFRDIKTSDVIQAPEFVSNYEPALKKFKWDSFTRNSKLPNEFVHNTGSVNIFTGYLGLFTKIHENMNKFTENFQNQTEELKETKRVFNILHSIDREYYILHTSHPKIMMFDWKTRFGVEPIDMFNYKAHIDAPSPKFFHFKDKLAQKLASNTPSTTKKATKKPLRKSELMNVISLIKTKGPKIKSRLHDFLEKSMLKSVHQVVWEPDTIQDVYKPKEILELAVFLKYQPKDERHVMFYLMDDVTFEKLPPAIKEKGRAIKKLIEKEMKNQLNFDEDELEDEPNEEEELRHRTILRILDSPATIQRTIGSADFIPNTTDLSPQAINNHVVPNNIPEKPKKIEVEDPPRPPSRRGGRRGGRRRRGSSAGRRGKSTPRNKRNNDADYITDEETEETNHEDNRKASATRDEDYGSERGDEDPNPAEMEMQKELLKDLMNSFKKLEEGKATENNTDEEEDRESFDAESEADDTVPFEELEDEPEEEEDGHDFDGLSFCTNSDVSEVFYEEYADFKANEEVVMERIYTNHLSEYNILDNFHSVIITLDQEAITNVISFFASEHYYDFRYPTVELNNNVETYYRQLELLMINPGNQVKVLHTLSFAISAPLESLNIPTLSQHNHLNFTMNILQFLHFYVRANPQSFFISDTDDLQEYNSYIDVITVKDLPKEVLAIREMNLVTRLLTLFSRKCTENHELLARKIVNLLCFLAKVSCDRKYMLTLGDYELNLLKQIILSRHCLESPVFRKRVGKLFRHLGRVAEYKDVFLHIEKKIVQDESQELISLLTDKYDQINQYYKKNLGGVKSLSFEDVKNINNILLCPKLELYQEILRCLDDHLAANINTMLIINFIEKMKEAGQINKMISTICQILIMMKKIKELNQVDFPMVIPSVEAYIFSLAYMYYLLRQAKNLGDVKLKSLKSLTTKNSVQLAEELELEKFEDELNNENLLEKLEELALYTKDLIGLVFKANLSKISKDSRVLQILSALNVIPSLATKEKVMRMYFNPGLSEESQFILPLTIRRNSILSDSLRAIEQNYGKLKRPSTSLKITFAKEAGVDEGGLKKEWLALLINGIFDPKVGLFRLSHNQRCLYPNPSSFVVPKALSLFKTAGIFIGLSIKENIPTGISFTRGFLRAILNQDANMNDLEELDPELAKSLTYIIHNPIGDLEVNFNYETEVLGKKETIELVENGHNKLLTDDNKHEYVNLFIQAKLVKEIEVQTKEFKKGLFEIVPESLIKLFLPYELETLICGQSQVDIEDLMQNVQYRDCSKSDKLIVWFWEVVEEFELEERMSLLFFITGSSSIPYGGFKETKITIIKSGKSPNTLPVAHTCYSELELPNYESREALESKLRFAISEGKEGFHIA